MTYQIKLSDEEIELVLIFRAEKAAKQRRDAQFEKQKLCDHNFQHDFNSKYMSYSKCTKCNMQKAALFKTER